MSIGLNSFVCEKQSLSNVIAQPGNLQEVMKNHGEIAHNWWDYVGTKMLTLKLERCERASLKLFEGSNMDPSRIPELWFKLGDYFQTIHSVVTII